MAFYFTFKGGSCMVHIIRFTAQLKVKEKKGKEYG